MKFLIAKNDNLFCFGCPSQILHGEHYIGLFFLDKANRRRRLIFHVDCYRQWHDNLITRRYEAWKSNQTEPKKRGRPKIYQDGKRVHRTKVLLYYHRKAGNEDRIRELREELDGLRI